MSHGSGRIHYMDAMRATLMMFGIVLHSSQVFNPAQNWLIGSDQTFALAGWLVDAIGIFRMPAFFIVAGFFCLLSMQKYTPRDFATMRVERLAVPLVVCALLLNSLQAAILSSYGVLDFNLVRYLAEGRWMSHLWFLNHLLVYVGFAYVVSSRGWQLPGLFGRYAAAACSILSPFTLLALLAATHLVAFKALAMTGALGAGLMVGTFDLYSIAWNLPYFLFGMVLGLRRALLRQFAAVSPPVALAVVVLCAPAGMAGEALDSAALRAGAQFLQLLATWFAAALCFRVFHRFANRRSALMASLSGASYTVYLVHHLLVVVFGIVLIQLGIGGPLGLAILIPTVAACALLIHRHVVATSAAARYLFNGIRTPNAGIFPVWLHRRHT